MLTAADLVIPGRTPQAHTPKVTAPPVAPAPLTPLSTTAKVLASVWSGNPVTVVDSPPGAGKTTLAVTVVAHLAVRAGLNVLVATPTKAQAVSLCHRLVGQVPTEMISVRLSGIAPGLLPRGLANMRQVRPKDDVRVWVRTLASAALSPPPVDVIVVEEAYQADFATVACAAEAAEQILLVGDPGQIGPVIKADPTIWARRKFPPHRPAPVCFAAMDTARSFRLPETWRLGPDTASVVNRLYDFDFDSAAADSTGRHVRQATMPDGTVLAEVASIVLPDSYDGDSLDAANAVVDRVLLLRGATLSGRAGGPARPADDSDIAVVVSRNSQVSMISGMLRAAGVAKAVVGTADRLQGGEWPLVVALDPAYGAGEKDSHASSPGRLCVMLSRSDTHLTWVHDSRWAEVVGDVSKGAGARRHLLSVASGQRRPAQR